MPELLQIYKIFIFAKIVFSTKIDSLIEYCNFQDIAVYYTVIFCCSVLISQKYISLAPNNFELSDSAAIPQVGNTSLLALRNIASLRKGHKLLINGASGGVGTFALQIKKIHES